MRTPAPDLMLFTEITTGVELVVCTRTPRKMVLKETMLLQSGIACSIKMQASSQKNLRFNIAHKVTTLQLTNFLFLCLESVIEFSNVPWPAVVPFVAMPHTNPPSFAITLRTQLITARTKQRQNVVINLTRHVLSRGLERPAKSKYWGKLHILKIL